MKNTLQFSKAVITAIFFMFCSSQVHAIGLGVAAGMGYEDWRNDVNYSGKRQMYNFGFVYDTAVRRDQFINYRFTLLRENNAGGRMDMWGFSTTHEIGFGMVRRPNFRFWVGPRAKFIFHNKLKLNTDEQVVLESGDWFSSGGLGDVTGTLIGGAIGLNVHLPENVSFLFSAAFLTGGYNGDTDYSTRSGKSYDDLDVDSTGLYLNMGVVIRIDE